MKKELRKRPLVMVDLDGTLAEQLKEYQREIGKPIMPMVELIRKEIESGAEVKIFTARASDWADELEKLDIERFCVKYFGKVLPITAIKEHEIARIYDDRCIQVEKNTGKLLNDNRGIPS